MPFSTAVRIGVALALLGAALALSTAAVLAWADFEALSYFQTGAGYAAFGGLRCPSLLARRETARVSASFENPTESEIQPNYRVAISGKSELRKIAGLVTLPPHGRADEAWTVSAGDIVLGHFIMVKLHVLPVAGYATRQATCGILALDLRGLPGNQAVILVVLVSGLLTISGLAVPALVLTPRQKLRFDIEAASLSRRSQQALGIASTSAILPALGDAWLIAWALCVVSTLLLLIVLRDAVSQPDK